MSGWFRILVAILGCIFLIYQAIHSEIGMLILIIIICLFIYQLYIHYYEKVHQKRH